MEIVKRVDFNDLRKILPLVRDSRIPYITDWHMLKDFFGDDDAQLYILYNNDKPGAIVTTIYDSQYNYLAIKRLLSFTARKGYATRLLLAIISRAQFSGISSIGCTPWDDNSTMIHLVNKLGFNYQYSFQKKWTFYKKVLDNQ